MRLDDIPDSDDVVDRRGESGPRSGMGFPFPMGGGGQRASGGGGSIMGLLLLLVIGWVLGINPLKMLGGGGLSGSTSGTPQIESQQPGGGPVQASGEEQLSFARMKKISASTNAVWASIFQRSGEQYPAPKINIFRNAVQTACGIGQSAAGPFYCPGDRQVYLDLAFFDELATRFGAPGDFAQAYVVAHEVGHHIQTITGVEEKVRRAQRGGNKNELQVRMELQADCYAGIWTHHAQQTQGILEQGDLEEGLKAAFAVGDDTIQKQTQGYVQPDSFTHGSAQQRMDWFKRGYQSGDVQACDTFSA
jgi:uncharacterized protein